MNLGVGSSMVGCRTSALEGVFLLEGGFLVVFGFFFLGVDSVGLAKVASESIVPVVISMETSSGGATVSSFSFSNSSIFSCRRDAEASLAAIASGLPREGTASAAQDGTIGEIFGPVRIDPNALLALLFSPTSLENGEPSWLACSACCAKAIWIDNRRVSSSPGLPPFHIPAY